nr:hypothetical protein [Streptomyces viridochromogenes]
MSSARRPLLTTTAAATLLGALWFVPSANATSDSPVRDAVAASPSPQVTEQARIATRPRATRSRHPSRRHGQLRHTPYVVGGTLCLTLGAGFVVYSVRRERLGF